jgi:hypothetical protein
VPVLAQVDSVPVPPQPDTIKTVIRNRVDTIKTAAVRPVIFSDPPTIDSFSRRPVVQYSWEISKDTAAFIQVFLRHPYFAFAVKPGPSHSDIRKKKAGKEVIFYTLLALLFLFALLKQSFAKYFYDLFRVFFRTTLKQRQIREQLMQMPVPSLFFNIFFVASAGLYINFMLHYFQLIGDVAPGGNNFWLLYLYCCAALSLIYLGKFLGLKIAGWLFNMKKAADSYIFIVFIINKVIGIFLLPFLILLAFSNEPVYTISLVLSWCGIGALLLYRFILGFAAIRNEVRFNLFHFFLYLCAFEITPLLLIYRLLLLIFK